MKRIIDKLIDAFFLAAFPAIAAICIAAMVAPAFGQVPIYTRPQGASSISGGTAPGGNDKSVPFIHPAGTWAQDANFTYDTTTGIFNTTILGLGTSADLFVVRDAANILAQRNSTTGQCLRVYNTFTDASNYERGEICWSGNVFTLQTAAAGTGTTRALNLNAPSGKLVNLQVNNVSIGSIGANGLILATAAVANQLRTSQTTPPTCTTNCGTPGNVCTGTDTFMTCTMGTTPASGVLITFQGTWATAPPCIVQMALAGMVVGKQILTAATTTTTITLVTNGTAPATGDKYHIHCGGIS